MCIVMPGMLDPPSMELFDHLLIPCTLLRRAQTVIDIDTVGTFNMSHAAFPKLRDHGQRLFKL